MIARNHNRIPRSPLYEATGRPSLPTTGARGFAIIDLLWDRGSIPGSNRYKLIRSVAALSSLVPRGCILASHLINTVLGDIDVRR